MRKILKMFLVTISFLVVMGCSNNESGTESVDTEEENDVITDTPDRIVLQSGPTGGGWYSSASKIGEILMREIDGLNVTVTEGSGEGNIKDVADGTAQLGYTYSDTFYNAINGEGTFEGESYDNLAGIASLFPSYFQAFTQEDSDVETFNDFTNGVHILPGQQSFSGYAFVENLLENYYDITFDQIEENGGQISHTGFDEMSTLLQDNHADVAMAITAAPSSFIMELSSVTPTRFLEIEPDIAEQIEQQNPGFVATEMAANFYEGQKETVSTVNSYSVIFGSDDLPEEFVQRVNELLLENKDELVDTVPDLEFMEEETILDGFSDAPVHPGAE